MFSLKKGYFFFFFAAFLPPFFAAFLVAIVLFSLFACDITSSQFVLCIESSKKIVKQKKHIPLRISMMRSSHFLAIHEERRWQTYESQSGSC